jgi:hypothetical protein
MATPREWANGYLSQAREDLKGAAAVSGQAPSVFGMLLQMTFEKMAKAALLRSKQMTIGGAQSTHAAAGRMVHVLRLNRRILRELGDGNEYAWKEVFPLVTELERAHPKHAAADAPKLEYPWEDAATRDIRWPARDLPVARRFGDPQLWQRPVRLEIGLPFVYVRP